VVCHTLPLFGKSPLGIISCDFLYDSFTLALPLLSFSVSVSALPLFGVYADPLHNQPSLESAMLRVPVLATMCGCGTNFIAFLYKA